MKRMLVFAFAAMLSLSACLVGCSSETEVLPGGSVETGGLSVVVDADAVWAKNYVPGSGFFGFAADDGETCFVVSGTLANGGSENIDVEDLAWSIAVDGSSKSDLEPSTYIKEADGYLSSDSVVSAGSESEFFIGFYLPETVKKDCAELSVSFAVDGSGYCVPFENAAVTDLDSATCVSLGKAASNDECKVKINAVTTMDEILPPSPLAGMDYVGYGEDEQGMTWVVFQGSLTNKSNNPVYEGDLVSGLLIKADGSEYETEIVTLDSDEMFSFDDVASGETKPVYMYASLPDSMVKKGSKVALDFRLSGKLYEVSATL